MTAESETVLIASFGGCESKALTEELKKLNPTRRILHTHAVPAMDEELLGFPIFNRFTLEAEGPFSKCIKLNPETTKIIQVFGDPGLAYESCICFEHFCHMWSESSYFYKTFGFEKPPTDGTFNVLRSEHESSKKDILNFSKYMRSWIQYADFNIYDILFFRYEKLGKNWDVILNFLNITTNSAVQSTAATFNINTCVPKSETMQIFEGKIQVIEELPDYKLFLRKKNNTLSPIPLSTSGKSDYSTPQIEAADSKYFFTFTSPKAGIGDLISRMMPAYNAVRSVLDHSFILQDYRNYHCPEINFFKIFGLSASFPTRQLNEGSIFSDNISVTDFLFWSLYDLPVITSKKNLSIDLNTYNKFIYDLFFQFYSQKEDFRQYLSYQRMLAEKDLAQTRPNSILIVAHFRQSDLIQVEKQGGGSTFLRLRHPLLCMNDVFEYISANEEWAGTQIDLAIVSDGVSSALQELKQTHSNTRNLRFLQQLAKMNEAASEYCSLPNVMVIDTVVGKSLEDTMKTFDYFHQADFIITSASSFPTVFQITGLTKVYWVKGSILSTDYFDQ